MRIVSRRRLEEVYELLNYLSDKAASLVVGGFII